MRIVCISDTHNLHGDIKLPDGDVLIHAGDATATGTLKELETFLVWFNSQPHKHKIYVAGNHDTLMDTKRDLMDRVLLTVPNVTYLRDSGVEIEGEYFYGTPYVKGLPYWAFGNYNDLNLTWMWAKIPNKTTVLITHMPAWGYLDYLTGVGRLGSETLTRRLHELRALKLHVFGHIHDSYGIHDYDAKPIRVNAAQCCEPTLEGRNYIKNLPIVVEI